MSARRGPPHSSFKSRRRTYYTSWGFPLDRHGDVKYPLSRGIHITIITVDPATEETIQSYELMSREEVFSIVREVDDEYQSWRRLTIEERTVPTRALAGVLRENQEEWASLMSREMGKPITESRAEIEKCAWTAEVYAENATAWLEDEPVDADGKAHSVVYQPLGTILAIMPWNFPFWQALRFGIPTLLAGNTAVLKHASNVTGSALAIEDVFSRAGFPPNAFRTVITDHATVAELIGTHIIRGVSLTGSVEAGRAVAELAGRNLKPTVLELGGSDPFIVLDDADIESAVKGAVTGRMINTGQSCIAAKRFMVMEEVVEDFTRRFTKAMEELVVGDPRDDATQVGPLVNRAALEDMEEVVKDAVDRGAKVETGGERWGERGFFFKPTVLSGVTADMKVAREEVFGPVAPIMVIRTEDEAVEVANSLEFGLGGCVWSRDLKRGERIARRIESGAVFVNNFTKSDPRMPFGGIKDSGIGRELSRFGIREFTNVKGLSIYESEG